MSSSITTETFEAPGATITYDVRGKVGDDVPLLLIGCPMGAEGFGTLANLLPERTVVTYDPRGVGRSVRTDGAGELRPEGHAGDLHRLVEVLGGGPVDVMASSGGAVNALAWVAHDGDDVRMLVAHEPPLATLLPDREAVASAIEEMHRTYQRDGIGQAMARFVFMVGFDGELPDGFQFPPLDPAQFGLPAEDDGSRDDALLGQNIRGLTGYRPDVEALRSAGTHVVVARGAASGQTMAARAADAMAALLGTEPAVFPGHHGGFLGGEYGMPGEPEPFAERLREVLAAAPSLHPHT